MESQADREVREVRSLGKQGDVWRHREGISGRCSGKSGRRSSNQTRNAGVDHSGEKEAWIH